MQAPGGDLPQYVQALGRRVRLEEDALIHKMRMREEVPYLPPFDSYILVLRDFHKVARRALALYQNRGALGGCVLAPLRTIPDRGGYDAPGRRAPCRDPGRQPARPRRRRGRAAAYKLRVAAVAYPRSAALSPLPAYPILCGHNVLRGTRPSPRVPHRSGPARCASRVNFACGEFSEVSGLVRL
jgi:hypothetical protein